MPDRSRSLGPLLAAVLFYAAAVLLLSWPLPSALSTAVAAPGVRGGLEGAWLRADLDLVLWILASVARNLATQPARLFEAGFFHPAPDTLAGSETLIGVAVVSAPIYWASGNLSLTYNLTHLFVVWLAAVTSFVTVRAWTGSASAALLAGAAVAFSPYVVADWSRLHWSAVSLFPLVLLLVERGAANPTPRRLAALAAVTALQLLAGVYIAFELVVLLACYAPLLVLAHRRNGSWRVLPALAVAALPSVPFALQYERYAETTFPLTRMDADAILRATEVPPDVLAVDVVRGATAPILLLAAVGLALGPRAHRATRAGLGLAAVFGFLLALGPDAPLLPGTTTPGIYSLATDALPGFGRIRGPVRFVTVTFVAVGLLAGFGAARIGQAVRDRGREVAARGVAVATVLGALVLVVARAPDTEPTLRAIDPDGREIDRWLRERPERGAVLELPVGSSALDVATLATTTEAMLGATRHGRPVVNGYTGHPPRSHELLAALGRRLPDADALEDLCALTDLRFLVVHLDRLPYRRRPWERLGERRDLRPVATLGDTRVYEVPGPCGGLKQALRDELRNPDIQETLRGRPLDGPGPAPDEVRLTGRRARDVAADVLAFRAIDVTNLGHDTWAGLTTATHGRLELFSRWTEHRTGRSIERSVGTPLARDLAPGETTRVRVELQHPPPGDYRLDIELGRRDGSGRIEPLTAEAGFAIDVRAGVPLCQGEPPTPVGAEDAGRRPSVLLVVLSSVRRDRLGAYGFDGGRTRTLDRLAAESVVFEAAVAASSRTLPAHAAIAAARSPGARTGARETVGPLVRENALAEAFHCAGYATAAFVGDPGLDEHTGLDRGFATWDDILPRGNPNAATRAASHTTLRARRWLEEHPDRPVFLFVHYQDPHGPYRAPRRLGRGIERPTRNPDPLLRVNPDDSGRGGLPAFQALAGVRRASEYEHRYLTAIRATDRWLGVLLAAFEHHRPEAGHVVLVTSDHGVSLGENDHWFDYGHGCTPELASIPLLLRGPGLSHARRDEPVSHVDILPTLLELAGIAPPPTDGVALGPVLRGERHLPPRTVSCRPPGPTPPLAGPIEALLG